MLRYRRHRSAHIAVYISDVVDRGVVTDDGGVVDIRNLGDVHGSIRDVHAVHVPLADAIRRNINFTRPEWKPGYGSSGAGTPADEGHQSRCINRPLLPRSGDPTPTSFDRYPAAIVKWRVAPVGIVDPRPSPGIDPGPMSIVIRSPAWFDMRKPNCTVFWIRSPVSV